MFFIQKKKKIEDIPKELKWRILVYLPIEEIIRNLFLSKSWFEVSNNQNFWKEVCMNNFPRILKVEENKNLFIEIKDWKKKTVNIFSKLIKIAKEKYGNTNQWLKFRYVLVGDTNSGKTKLMDRFINGKFEPDRSYGLMGVSWPSKTIAKFKNKQNLNVEIIDIMQRFNPNISAHTYRYAEGIFLCFDLTNKKSFDSIVNRYYNEATDHCELQTELILVGLKKDLLQKGKKCKFYSEVLDFCKKSGLKYFETSSKENENVSELFNYICKLNWEIVELSKKSPFKEYSFKPIKYCIVN